jgi:ATP-dependent exoDNAse (exonuclease V) beta subunit
LLSALEVPSYAAGKQAMGLLLSPLGRRDGTESPRLQAFVASIESERARNEVTRLLYVAATRAVNRLHLFGNVRLNKAGEANQPTKTTLLARLWPAIREGFEARREALPPPPEVDVANPAPPAPRPPLSRLPVDWELPAAPAPALPLPPAPEGRKSVYLWAGQTAAHVGTVTHAFLERMANEGLSDWDAAALDGCQAAVSRQLVFLGVGPDELAAATDKVLKALKRTLEDPQGRFLLGAHAHAENEWELTAELDGNWVNVTLDRSFVDGGGVRWIVDWKTSSHEGQGADEFLDQEAERYTAQLQNYARVLSKLERRPQKLVLYFPLMQAQREVPLPPLAG